MPTRLLVIDASVACSCGDNTAVAPRAKQCRDFLLAVLHICHKAVFTPTLSTEWRNHQSRFARQWLVSMTARKKVIRIAPGQNDFEQQLRTMPHSNNLQKAIKDCHLIHAALVTERSVVSLDEEAREIYLLLSKTVKKLRAVVWVNPSLRSELPIDWLTQGAPLEAHRQLGYQAAQSAD